MHVLWFCLMAVALSLVVWRHQVWSYVRGQPHLGTGLRRYINKTTDKRPTALIADAEQREQWAQDLCGATPVSFREFMESGSTPECVVSIIDERRLDPEERLAFYHKLDSVPYVVRVRNRLVSVPEDIKDFDALGVISKMTGNVIIERNRA
jgi:hypothetical protein